MNSASSKSQSFKHEKFKPLVSLTAISWILKQIKNYINIIIFIFLYDHNYQTIKTKVKVLTCRIVVIRINCYYEQIISNR